MIFLMAAIYYGPLEIRTKAAEQSPAARRAVAGHEVIVTYDEAFMVVNNIIVEPTALRFDSAGSDAPEEQPQDNVLDYNCFDDFDLNISNSH